MERPPVRGIKETCIYTRHLQRSREFYEGALGLECFSFVAGSHAFFRAGYSVLLCFDPDASREQKNLPRHFAEGEQHFAFEVGPEQYGSWLQWLKLKDVPVEYEHEWPGGYRSVYFRDPDGHCLEIIQAGMWEHGMK